MNETFTLQLAQRGVLTLPKALRDRYDLQPGDVFTLVDVEGVFMLNPRRSAVDRLADSLSVALVEEGESLESVLAALRQGANGGNGLAT